MKRLGKYFLLVFLLVFTVLPAVDANGWGDPLATDPSGDGSVFGEDILAVDAQYANELVYFRFQLGEPVMNNLEYCVFIGCDSNISNDYSISGSDSGPDLFLRCNPQSTSSDTILTLYLAIFGGSEYWVKYNMTANNGSAMAWSASSIVPYFAIHNFENGSQAELAFGVNWTWVVSEMAGLTWDGCTLYLEFRTSMAGTDWCPDRTANPTDYIEWTLCPDDGIPGFDFLFLSLAVLAVVAFAFLEKKRVLI